MPILIPKHGMLKPHGTMHVFGCDGPERMHDTVMCAHCNRHGLFRPGCGNKLGKCPKCMGVICNSPACAECVPIEKRLDLYEAGKIASL